MTSERGLTATESAAQKQKEQYGSSRNLVADLARSRRAERVSALLLVAPLLIFQLLAFVVPVGMFLSRSTVDLEVARALPLTLSAIKDWTPASPLPDAAYAALVSDLKRARTPPELAAAANRLNYASPGMRALMMTTRARVQSSTQEPRLALTEISQRWESPEVWAAIKQSEGPLSLFYFLSALDLKRTADNSVAFLAPSESAFRLAIQRTFEIAFAVTLLTLMVGFPFAYLMANSSRLVAGILMVVVLLPFWTAIMVRVLSWLVLLGREGIINHALMSVGIIERPLDLLYNRLGVYLALVHIFAPFMVLPIYSVMKSIPKVQQHAAASLGASPAIAFLRIYLPQVSSGVAAGILLVFIQCLGVFVVPAILGGPNEQNLPMLITFYVNRSLNWGLAASLSILLLASVCVLYWLFVKLTKSTVPTAA